jgi:hypothetical protein
MYKYLQIQIWEVQKHMDPAHCSKDRIKLRQYKAEALTV